MTRHEVSVVAGLDECSEGGSERLGGVVCEGGGVAQEDGEAEPLCKGGGRESAKE